MRGGVRHRTCQMSARSRIIIILGEQERKEIMRVDLGKKLREQIRQEVM